jgi:acyl phosphate:glycerol-3-phosphate acyltransferase
VTPWLLLVVAYLLGAVPASYIAGRLAQGIDLREHGSGNLGATNTFRVLGARVAAPVMLFDILKGTAPVVLFPRWDGAAAWGWALAYGAAAIVGHVFSVYMRFRGGKGVATAAGVFLALAPLQLLGGLAVWLAVLRGTRMVSAASISAALAVALLAVVTPVRAEVRLLALGVVAFVVLAHRSNLVRIMRGEEPRFGRRREPEATVAAAAAAADGEGRA